jgi:hypothetical protein
MARFIAVGCSEKELQSLNRVQKHQQVLFLSNILEGNGGQEILTETEGRRTLDIYEISLQGCYGNRDRTQVQSHSAGSGVRAGADKSGQVDH